MDIPHFVSPFICWRTFELFPLLAVVSSAAVNNGIQLSVWDSTLNYFQCISENWIAKSHGNYIFNFQERVSQWLCYVTFPPTLYDGSNFLICSPIFIIFLFFFCGVLRLEFWILHILGQCSTTWPYPQSFCFQFIFHIGSCAFAQVGLWLRSFYLCLQSSWYFRYMTDFRCIPPCLATFLPSFPFFFSVGYC
jgi:hypothetical protein